MPHEVPVGARSPDRFAEVIGEARAAEIAATAERLRERLAGRIVWHVNSTASGGGVAEMLRSLLAYARGVGIDTRWLVIEGDPEFFRVTKRLHNALHGFEGDGGRLDDAAREIYERTLAANAAEFATLIRPRDVALLHDPQTAGLIPHLARAGVLAIWRCHVGADRANERVRQAWSFLQPYLEQAAVFVFSREAYIPDACDHGRALVLPPSIDPFSPKNQRLDEDCCRAILAHAGLVEGPPGPGARSFVRQDGSPGRVDRSADVQRLGRGPDWEAPLVVQVSRWDHLKDPLGVMRGFCRFLERRPETPAYLLLAGPNVRAVPDDPEGVLVFDEVEAAWRKLPHAVRHRVQLACLPMTDLEENAAIVNALQRHAAVVVQKSLAEGFGLTVTEAMWKARPVLASAVGGIQDQIEHGVHGLLLPDPTDLGDFADCLCTLLDDPATARKLGDNAHARVVERYLGASTLVGYAELIESLDA